MLKVRKRDKRIVDYNDDFIVKAVNATVKATGYAENVDTASIAGSVTAKLMQKYDKGTDSTQIVDVEAIQDAVEQALIESNNPITAKAYILYRADRTKAREQSSEIIKVMDEITNCDAKESDLKRENANVDADSPMGTMLKYGSETSKYYLTKGGALPADIAQGHISGDYHIHDLDFYMLTLTCCQISLGKMLRRGFSTGHGFLRQPTSINSASALTCILIQANQNDQHGGQAIWDFEYGLAPYVGKTFISSLLDVLNVRWDIDPAIIKEIYNSCIGDVYETSVMSTAYCEEMFNRYIEDRFANIDRTDWTIACKKAAEHAEKATAQAMEALVHNLNTMHSRAGAQVPFSSVNFGTDTSIEGRLVIKSLLNAIDAGLGMGEFSIFPVAIFKVKEGVNFNTTDPNYDLFRLACKVSARRMFPNFAFIDAPFNKQYYKEGRPETEAAYMGCRTRVLGNVHDKEREIVAGRGNLSFTTVNLPRLGIKASMYADSCKCNEEQKLEYFFDLLEKTTNAVIRQLEHRFEIQARRKVKNYPVLMQQGVWIDSENLCMSDEIREVIKHGTLTVGFIGLAECLTALIGEHHGQSERAQQLGLKIVKFMRDMTDKKAEETQLNFSLIATPAEGLSGTFIKKDRKMFGIIKGVTDKEFYTNSNHIPVNYKITASKKIALEAPYHALTNGGHICYIEMDGDLTKNVDAFEKVIRYMKEQGVGYGSINHPADRDPVCGYVGIIDDVCPKCGRREGERVSDEVWARLQLGKYLNANFNTFGLTDK